MKISGRHNSRGRSVPMQHTKGATTVTPSDNKPNSVRPKPPAVRSEAEKLEARPKLPANRTKVKPIGHAKKPRSKAA